MNSEGARENSSSIRYENLIQISGRKLKYWGEKNSQTKARYNQMRIILFLICYFSQSKIETTQRSTEETRRLLPQVLDSEEQMEREESPNGPI